MLCQEVGTNTLAYYAAAFMSKKIYGTDTRSQRWKIWV